MNSAVYLDVKLRSNKSKIRVKVTRWNLEVLTMVFTPMSLRILVSTQHNTYRTVNIQVGGLHGDRLGHTQILSYPHALTNIHTYTYTHAYIHTLTKRPYVTCP